MSTTGRILGIAAGALGLAAAGSAVGIAQRRRSISRRDEGDAAPLGSLRSPPLTVIAEDGVPLHVEIDELDEHARRRRGYAERSPVTVVFVHGYALTLDCWHFQRVAYRGLVRAVYYDQRSHGRSGRSTEGHATIDQLAKDLKLILDAAVPEGPVVLVGHSMGGMTVIALAEHHPELFGDRIIGVGLVATTAGGLGLVRAAIPFVPSNVGADLLRRGVALLARGHRTVDGLRRIGADVALVATDAFAFGDEVPQGYVEFVDKMLGQTSFEVLAEFFPNFPDLEKYHAVHALSVVPTTIICGTADKMTSISHSRKLHSRIEGSELIECEGAGHMVIMERHDQVNAALDQLLAAATADRA